MAKLLHVLAILISSGVQAVSTTEDFSRQVEIRNESGAKIQVYWINPNTRQQEPFSRLFNGAHLSINTFVNHTFIVRQTKEESRESRISYVTVTDSDGQVVHVKENLELQYADASHEQGPKDDEISGLLRHFCPHSSTKASPSHINISLPSLVSCYEEKLTDVFRKKNDQILSEDRARKQVASMLENYTCADPDLETSPGKSLGTWEYNKELHDVEILHERPDSQIHLIKNFITTEECEAFRSAAKKSLHRGTVADGNGGSKLSLHRKAWQAGIRVPWEEEKNGDPIARYTRRMYAYANHASGYEMDVVGQEDIMSIQYFGENGEHPAGSSYSLIEPDRYMPHCDGDCTGLPHKHGARVATMVSYCTVPEKGGATNFQNAGVHVKPEFGAGVFFSYMNQRTKEMDTGWTSHSGCPVTEGTKRIVVHWMRVGVSAAEPWDSFNTLNVPNIIANNS